MVAVILPRDEFDAKDLVQVQFKYADTREHSFKRFDSDLEGQLIKEWFLVPNSTYRSFLMQILSRFQEDFMELGDREYTGAYSVKNINVYRMFFSNWTALRQ